MQEWLGRSHDLLAGEAGGRWWRGGAGVDLGCRVVWLRAMFGDMPVVGLMPVVWGRVLDLCGQIWDGVGFFLLALRLLWSEMGVEGKATTSFNKAVARCYPLRWRRCAGRFPLAGRGGEERNFAGVLFSADAGWRRRLLLRLCEFFFGSSSSAALR